jgi:hypothetical protein
MYVCTSAHPVFFYQGSAAESFSLLYAVVRRTKDASTHDALKGASLVDDKATCYE